ncbi:50S ribosomal protein L9 [Candidatus Providencia siddallii]|uniref:Large ribosomal subunit protein bL9 n=1 Tax=Candidatus Providencia siddallii TaxID=1715285 RepID=A0A0M6W730_9GAMM|nr:50S ribosomal protein L9 [Candidatus Providencia siddallii]
MKIILLDKIKKLGDLGNLANVRSGYARNYLIPQGKAITATKKNIDIFKKKRTELKTELANILSEAKSRALAITELRSITIYSKAGDEGKLFGSIGTRDIVEAIASAGIKITKNEVRLKNKLLRSIGQYKVDFQLHSEVTAKLNIIIAAK